MDEVLKSIKQFYYPYRQASFYRLMNLPTSVHFISAAFVFSHCDTSLGRVDLFSLSHQTLLELLLPDLSKKSACTDSKGSPIDITEWNGLIFNVHHEVSEISWNKNNWDIQGSIDLEWLPPTVLSIDIQCNMRGLFDASYLPECLTKCILSWNKLKGSLDTSALPRELTDLDLNENGLSGTIDWASLPTSLRRISLYRNQQFSGSVNLCSLPQTLELLNIADNAFTGSITLSDLPCSLRLLLLEENKLSGSLDLEHLPATLEKLMLCYNAFSGSIMLTKLPEKMTTLYLHENKLEQDVLTLRLSENMEHLTLFANRFTRIVDEEGKTIESRVIDYF